MKTDGAVLSQPHSNSSFPKDSHPTQILIEDQDKKEDLKHADVHKVELLPEDSSKDILNPETADVPADYINEVVTEQPSSEPAICTNDELIGQSPPEILSINKSDIEMPSLNEHVSDNITDNSNLCSEKYLNVSITKPVPDVPIAISLDQIESDQLKFGISPPETNVEPKCNTEHLWGKEISDSTMVISSGSFTHLDSARGALMNENSSYDNSSSTLVIPDFPSNVSHTVVNWECCALDDNSNDLFAVNETENSAFLVPNDQLSGNQNSPFHAISVDSFNNNDETWAEANKPNNLIVESQHSSGGEKDSHHSDGSSNSSKDDDDTDTAEIKEYDSKSTSSSGSHTTSSSSFVKCSPEENDNHSQRGHSPVSTTASDRSDVAKHESEQTYSGDENETATSSDIEILSPPNGESGDRNTSPLKHVWLSRPIRFRRSESPTSDSSKDSLMPVVNELEEVSYEDESHSTTLYDDKGKIFTLDENFCFKEFFLLNFILFKVLL